MSRLREQKYWSGLYFTEEEPCKTVCFSPHIFLVYLQISFTLKSRIYEPYQDIRLYERSLTVYTLLFKFVTNGKERMFCFENKCVALLQVGTLIWIVDVSVSIAI